MPVETPYLAVTIIAQSGGFQQLQRLGSISHAVQVSEELPDYRAHSLPVEIN